MGFNSLPKDEPAKIGKGSKILFGEGGQFPPGSGVKVDGDFFGFFHVLIVGMTKNPPTGF